MVVMGEELQQIMLWWFTWPSRDMELEIKQPKGLEAAQMYVYMQA